GSLQPGARHGDLGLAEAAGQRARAAAVTMANNTYRTSVILHCPPIAWAAECRIQLTADERLDELANPFAQTALDRIKPVVEKVRGGIGCRLERIRLHGNVRHGVVSVPALERRMIRGCTRRLRQPNSNPPCYAPVESATPRFVLASSA